jgi:hypothetical protein
VQHVERVAVELRHHMGVDHIMFATDFPHIECDWPNTRPFAERLFEGVPADEAFKIAAGNMLDFFHLRDTPDGPRGAGPARMTPRFGLNRFDGRSVAAFAADVARAETLGWDAALIPDSQLRRRDTYVMLAAAAHGHAAHDAGHAAGESGQSPSQRHRVVHRDHRRARARAASCSAGASATPAVRLAGLRPARVKELEDSTRLMRALLDGESVEVGAARPARLPHHRPVPIWIAAGGPRTLRNGRRRRRRRLHPRGHAPGKSESVDRRDPRRRRRGRPRSQQDSRRGIFHTVLMDDPARALLMGKSMAAGYYEYSPMLFDPPGLAGPAPTPKP